MFHTSMKTFNEKVIFMNEALEIENYFSILSISSWHIEESAHMTIKAEIS